jgi:hypothetical protein
MMDAQGCEEPGEGEEWTEAVADENGRDVAGPVECLLSSLLTYNCSHTDRSHTIFVC